jgi:hypothetical protein
VTKTNIKSTCVVRARVAQAHRPSARMELIQQSYRNTTRCVYVPTQKANDVTLDCMARSPCDADKSLLTVATLGAIHANETVVECGGERVWQESGVRRSVVLVNLVGICLQSPWRFFTFNLLFRNVINVLSMWFTNIMLRQTKLPFNIEKVHSRQRWGVIQR